jgi:hypothetical protein
MTFCRIAAACPRPFGKVPVHPPGQKQVAAYNDGRLDMRSGQGKTNMEEELLRWLGAFFTIVPGLFIAARLPDLFVGWAFVGLSVGSLIWIAVALLSGDTALLAQNIAITMINSVGIYRWLVWKEKPK